MMSKWICISDFYHFMNFTICKGTIIETKESAVVEDYCYVYYEGKVIDYVRNYELTKLANFMLYSDWIALERERQIKTILDE